MTAPVNGGDLVENLIYMAFKDKEIGSSRKFKEKIKKDYGYTVTSNLYAKILNYQIMRYGRALQDTTDREYVKLFGLKSHKLRRKHEDLTCRRQKTNRLIERVENEKNKCKKSIKRKNT